MIIINRGKSIIIILLAYRSMINVIIHVMFIVQYVFLFMSDRVFHIYFSGYGRYICLTFVLNALMLLSNFNFDAF